jgi:hypothetical protein
MKTILILLLLTLSSSVFGQSRSAGKIVVPSGYEPYDSLRMGYWGSEFYLNAFSDSVSNKYDYSLGESVLTDPLGSAKGTEGSYWAIPIYQLATYFKQRIFYGLPTVALLLIKCNDNFRVLNVMYKQSKGICFQCLCNFFQTYNGNVFFTSFEAAKIIRGKFGLHSEGFLSKSRGLSKVSYISRDDFDQIHNEKFNRIDV